ncbi:unnamed protein product [Didymodactylos carnosus]|uniref:Phosphatidylinositol transfer protein N-terminal domain-containing protein n=2 Tax=Didymodactylos carnosus TaxID=1234261 RepID=A0A813WHY2_9BILA|nr:unnamed protein product [Didymodactylos carnosus]CAF3645800.1 unnamed protein product [Didymodactylos carnosus]
MLLQEYRICLPLTVEEYRVGQLYMICKHCEEESMRDEGVEVVKNEPCNDEQYGSGQCTEKRLYLSSRLPSWIRSFIPNLFYITEKAWNYYPYTCSFLPRFSIVVETKYEDNNGTTDNCHNLSEEEVQNRKLEFLDIVADHVPEHKYKLSEDPTKFKSKKTGRGPLTPDWIQTFKPIMCAYKIVRVRFEVWGLQTRSEDFIQRTVRDILLLAHRQAFTWMDEWYDMSMEEVRKYEQEMFQTTNKKVMHSAGSVNSVHSTTMSVHE